MSSFYSSFPPSPVRDQRSILPLEPVLVSPYNYKSYPNSSTRSLDSASFRNRNAAHSVMTSQPIPSDNGLFPGAAGPGPNFSGAQSPHRSLAASPPPSSSKAIPYRASPGTAHRTSPAAYAHSHNGSDQPPLTQRALDAEFPPRRPPSGLDALLSSLAPYAPRFSGTCLLNVFLSLFPFLRIMRSYSVTRDLPCDLAAGFTVFVMQVKICDGYCMNMESYSYISSIFTSLAYLLYIRRSRKAWRTGMSWHSTDTLNFPLTTCCFRCIVPYRVVSCLPAGCCPVSTRSTASTCRSSRPSPTSSWAPRGRCPSVHFSTVLYSLLLTYELFSSVAVE